MDLPQLDARRFKLPPLTLARMDRAIHLSLLAGAEAIGAAGFQEGAWDPRRVKVIFGQLPLRERERELEIERRFTCERYLRLARDVLAERGLAGATLEALLEGVRARYTEGLIPVSEDAMEYYSGMACASRLAAAYGFSGGALSVDAACASSLVAVHAGALALSLGEADVVIAGGVAFNLLPEYFVALCALNVVCARGSFPFDDRAEGFVPSEGAVVMKRLEAAEAARDNILAVISGIGCSSDGRGTSLFAPSPEGQARAVERALEAAHVDPAWVDLVEAHGSGTRRSDVSEATAYGRVFASRGRDNPVALGSVKSQIGHLSSAAGIMGLIKASYALSHQRLPPMNGGEYPSPEIPFETLPLALSLESRPWRLPQQGMRRAGVSAFALGGSNYHVLLEEHDNVHRRDRRVGPSPSARPPLAPASTRPLRESLGGGPRAPVASRGDAVQPHEEAAAPPRRAARGGGGAHACTPRARRDLPGAPSERRHRCRRVGASGSGRARCGGGRVRRGHRRGGARACGVFPRHGPRRVLAPRTGDQRPLVGDVQGSLSGLQGRHGPLDLLPRAHRHGRGLRLPRGRRQRPRGLPVRLPQGAQTRAPRAGREGRGF